MIIIHPVHGCARFHYKKDNIKLQLDQVIANSALCSQNFDFWVLGEEKQRRKARKYSEKEKIFFCGGKERRKMFGDAMQLQWTASFFKFTSKLSPENVNANSLPSLNPFNFIGYRKMIMHYPKEVPINATYHSWVNVTFIIERDSRFKANYWGR